jgi:DNA-binding PadR family transcriptional regulator
MTIDEPISYHLTPTGWEIVRDVAAQLDMTIEEIQNLTLEELQALLQRIQEIYS